jgi:CRP-like cAMP-binding protein
VLTTGPDGREVPLNVLTPGDAFGELALVQQSPRSASVRASTPLEAFRLDRSVFLALMRIYPALSEAFGVVAELAALRAAGRLGLPLDELAASYVHMWLNRLCRSQNTFQEYVTYALLARVLAARSARERARR